MVLASFSSPASKVIKYFSCSAQLCTKLKVLIKINNQNSSNLRFESSKSIIIPPVYEVYRGYIVFAFSVCVFVCL